MFGHNFAGCFGNARSNWVACFLVVGILHPLEVVFKIGDGGIEYFRHRGRPVFTVFVQFPHDVFGPAYAGLPNTLKNGNARAKAILPRVSDYAGYARSCMAKPGILLRMSNCTHGLVIQQCPKSSLRSM